MLEATTTNVKYILEVLEAEKQKYIDDRFEKFGMFGRRGFVKKLVHKRAAALYDDRIAILKRAYDELQRD